MHLQLKTEHGKKNWRTHRSMNSLPRRKTVLFVARGSNEEDKADKEKHVKRVILKFIAKTHFVVGCDIKRFAKDILEANESDPKLDTIDNVETLTFSIFSRPSLSYTRSAFLLNIFSFGSIFMATSKNALSRNGTLASSPHAMVDL
jgi:hypothetical protein